jgi:hypothetical protein
VHSSDLFELGIPVDVCAVLRPHRRYPLGRSPVAGWLGVCYVCGCVSVGTHTGVGASVNVLVAFGVQPATGGTLNPLRTATHLTFFSSSVVCVLGLAAVGCGFEKSGFVTDLLTSGEHIQPDCQLCASSLQHSPVLEGHTSPWLQLCVVEAAGASLGVLTHRVTARGSMCVWHPGLLLTSGGAGRGDRGRIRACAGGSMCVGWEHWLVPEWRVVAVWLVPGFTVEACPRVYGDCLSQGCALRDFETAGA